MHDIPYGDSFAIVCQLEVSPLEGEASDAEASASTAAASNIREGEGEQYTVRVWCKTVRRRRSRPLPTPRLLLLLLTIHVTLARPTALGALLRRSGCGRPCCHGYGGRLSCSP